MKKSSSNFFANKKVLVTGGTGFVGSWFVDSLLSKGAFVRTTTHIRKPHCAHEKLEGFQADLTIQEEANRACEGVDYVFHAAGAVSAAGVTNASNPLSPITENLVLTSRVLQAAWSQKVKRILLFSSSTGYPEFSRPVEEDDFWNGETHPSYFGYGWMRRYLERIAEFAHQRSEMKVALCRPTAVYGERDDFDPATSHVIPALIRRAVAKENPFVVWGAPTVTRDFLHIEDLVEGCLLLLEKCPTCDPVNIGYGKTTSISEVVGDILEGSGHKNAQIEFDESKPTTIPFRSVNVDKAKSLLNFEPSISLKDGLKRTIDWYCDTK